MNPVRLTEPGLQLRGYASTTRAELAAVAWPLGDEPAAAVAGRLCAALAPFGATVLKADVFGALDLQPEVLPALAPLLGGLTPTWVAGEGCGAHGLAGITVFAVAGDATREIMLNGRAVGRSSDDGECRWVWLGGVLPADPTLAPEAQARDVFATLAAGLDAANLPQASLARTWFYFRDLLSWYGDFNAARTRSFGERGWLTQLPASTGIDANNAGSSALVAGALAAAPYTARADVQVLNSPLQGPAPAYGSSFSRAVEVRSAGLQRVWVSGTASIDPSGRTVHLGDAAGQIALTFQVIKALLGARGMDWSHVTRAIAYLESADYAPVLAAWLADHAPDLPIVVARAGICRGDLLFEVELDAAAAAPTGLDG